MRLLRHSMLTLCLLALCVAVTTTGFAQDKPAAPVEKAVRTYTTYLLTYNIYEVQGGKRVNTRTHKIVMSDNGQTGVSKSEMRIAVPNTSPVEFMTTGMKILSRIQSNESGVLLFTDVEMEYLSADPAQPNARPILHKAEAQSSTSIKLDKPFLLAAIEDQSNNQTYQIEVTITRQ